MPPAKQYFITITLPPRTYKKPAIRQLAVMMNALKSYSVNFFDTLTGNSELTNKSNIHFHGIATFRETDIECAEVSRLKFIDTAKQFSRVDVQEIKDLSNVEKYISKDITITSKVMDIHPNKLNYKFERAKYIQELFRHPTFPHISDTNNSLDIEIKPLNIN